MVSATERCRVCDEPLTPGAMFCPHCGARLQDDLDDDAAINGRIVDDDERTHGIWLLAAAIIAIVAIVAVVAIALATTSGGAGGNPPSTSVSPATTPTTSTQPPSTTSPPPTTRPPVTTPPST